MLKLKNIRYKVYLQNINKFEYIYIYKIYCKVDKWYFIQE